MMKHLLYLLLFLGSAIPPGQARAKDKAPAKNKGGPLTQASLFASASGRKVPWRGSQFVWRTAMSALTLDAGAEQTYNPYAAMDFSFRPWWWLGDRFYVRGQLDVTRELTEADATTYDGEAIVSDLRLVFGGAGLWTIPKVDISLSADVALALPTSKASHARTLLFSLAPGARLSRSFSWLGGVSVGYNVRFTPRLFRYTTAQRDSQPILHCLTPECDNVLATGRRNPLFRITQSVDVSAKILSWLGASAVFGHAVDWLHGVNEDVEGQISGQRLDNTNNRHITFFEIGVSFRPLDLLEIGLGASTLHPQRTAGAELYFPFFNRYTVFFLDLKVQADGVVSRIKRIVR